MIGLFFFFSLRFVTFGVGNHSSYPRLRGTKCLTRRNALQKTERSSTGRVHAEGSESGSGDNGKTVRAHKKKKKKHKNVRRGFEFYRRHQRRVVTRRRTIKRAPERTAGYALEHAIRLCASP
jgi:hypothetical protein